MTSSSRLTRIAGSLLMASALVLTGCDTDALLEVVDPDTVNPGTLEDPALADIVVAGAIGEFTTAYSGGESFISVTALMSDEFYSSGTFTTRTATDRRFQFSAQNGNTSDGTYINTHQARRALREASAQLDGVVDDGTIGRLLALEGYTYLVLGEGYCSGIPISNRNLETGEFEFGSGSSTAELFNAANALFDAAIARGGANANMARIGKGRALLNNGDFAGAAAAVASVPDDYVYFINHSDNASNNGIWGLQQNGRYSQSDNEGGAGTGLPFRSAGDTRIQFDQDPAGGFDAGIELYISRRYPLRASDTPMATGVEARLIEAEAALQGGDLAGMTGILNALRTDADALMAGMFPEYTAGAALAALAVPADAAAGRDLLFEERAYWLYLTGHRMGDLRRLIRQYGQAQADIFPSGAYFKGGDHGTNVSFEVDFDEANNPNYDLGTCNVDAA